jgi:hypothetical protein
VATTNQKGSAMMEWAKQTEDMLKTWADMQSKLQESWLKAFQRSATPQPTDPWEKTVQVWEESVKAILDTQVECAKLWAKSFIPLNSISEERSDWARQGEEMITQWTEIHKRLWEAWFSLAQRVDFSAAGGSWEREGRRAWEGWQEAMQKAMDVQTEWVRLWTVGQAVKNGK